MLSSKCRFTQGKTMAAMLISPQQQKIHLGSKLCSYHMLSLRIPLSIGPCLSMCILGNQNVYKLVQGMLNRLLFGSQFQGRKRHTGVYSESECFSPESSILSKPKTDWRTCGGCENRILTVLGLTTYLGDKQHPQCFLWLWQQG